MWAGVPRSKSIRSISSPAAPGPRPSDGKPEIVSSSPIPSKMNATRCGSYPVGFALCPLSLRTATIVELVVCDHRSSVGCFRFFVRTTESAAVDFTNHEFLSEWSSDGNLCSDDAADQLSFSAERGQTRGLVKLDDGLGNTTLCQCSGCLPMVHLQDGGLSPLSCVQPRASFMPA